MDLYIPAELINESCVLRAISDYSHLASIALKRDGRYWFFHFSNCRVQPLLTVREFENYLISLAVGNVDGNR